MHAKHWRERQVGVQIQSMVGSTLEAKEMGQYSSQESLATAITDVSLLLLAQIVLTVFVFQL